MIFDVVVLVAMCRVSGLGLGSEAEGRGPLSYPGADILRSLRLFSGLGHYYTLDLVCPFEEGERGARPPLL